MKKYTAIILIILTFLLTWAFWAFDQPAKTVPVNRQYSQLIASFAMAALFWINYISTRHRWIDDIFNGLDKSYIYHKYLSILAIIFIWVHNFTLKMGGFSGEGGPRSRADKMSVPPEGFKGTEGFREGAGNTLFGIQIEGKMLGSWSMWIFTAFVIFFIIAYKLEYQKWKTLHKLMLVPYAFGTIHYYLDSDYPVFSTSAYSIWMNIINAIGILSAIYMIFIYEQTAFKYRYKVSSISEIAKDTIQITGTTTGRKMKYKSGQFAFMKVLGRNKKFPSHPFTMSQAYRPGEIQFAVKVLGDDTEKLRNNLAVGDTIAVSGPFGKFNYKTGVKRQIWFAGGIGVTPFRSFLQSDVPQDYNVDFYYSYRNDEEGPYVDEIKAMQPPSNVKIHLIETSKGGRLGIECIEKYVNKGEQADVYLCGPKAMKRELASNLKRGKFKIRDFHHEYFQFK